MRPGHNRNMSTMRPLVSVLLITYNRIEHLRRTCSSFLGRCSYDHLELVVTDDGSDAKTQELIRDMRFDKRLLGGSHQGLGANTNRGLNACSGEYILQLQDDWDFIGPPDLIDVAVKLMQQRSDVHMVQFWRNWDLNFPKEILNMPDGHRAAIFRDYPGYAASGGFHIYSDRPFLRTRQSVSELGPYCTGLSPIETEEEYCRRFEMREDLRVAIIDGYGICFAHTGEDSTYNSTQKRENIRRALRTRPMLRYAWLLYVGARYGFRSDNYARERRLSRPPH